MVKYKPTWADKLYTLLMEQEYTEENMDYAASAVGAWLGEKAGSTMSREDFEDLLEKAIEDTRQEEAEEA